MRLPLTTSASTLLLAVLLAARAALAADLTVYLPSTPNPFGLPPATHATLAALGRPRASAPVTSVNTFVFRGVPAGSYLLDVHCTTDAFVPLRVDIAEDGAVEAWETFRGNDWDNKGERLVVRDGSAGRGFEVRAVGHKNYFMDRPTFSVLTILKNPMILLGIASMGLVFGMPKLLESMDPELRAEFEERQKEGPMAMLTGGGGGGGAGAGGGGGGGGRQQAENPIANFDMAAYLAGTGKKDSGSRK